MDEPKLQVKLLTVSAKLPKQADQGSSGYDLCSDEDCVLKPGRRKLVSTGIAIQLPENFEGQVRSRSGLCNKYGIFVLNGIGTIDESYRGEIKVILQNLGTMQFKISKGDRIAQLVLAKVEHIPFEVVEEFGDTSRGQGGFGSSGVK